MVSVYPVPLNRFKGKSKTRRGWPKPPKIFYFLLCSFAFGFALASIVHQPQAANHFAVNYISLLLGTGYGFVCAQCNKNLILPELKDFCLNAALAMTLGLLFGQIFKELLMFGRIFAYSNIWDFTLNFAVPIFSSWFAFEWYFTQRNK